MRWCLVVGVVLLSSWDIQGGIIRRGNGRVNIVPGPGPRNSRQTDYQQDLYSVSPQAYASPYAPQLPSAYAASPYDYSTLNDYLLSSYHSSGAYAPQQATYTAQPSSYNTPYAASSYAPAPSTYASSYTPSYLNPTTATSEDYATPTTYAASSYPAAQSQYVSKLTSAAAAYRSIADCLHSKIKASDNAGQAGSEYTEPIYGRNAVADVSSVYAGPAPVYTAPQSVDQVILPVADYVPPVSSTYNPTVPSTYTPTAVSSTYNPTDVSSTYNPTVSGRAGSVLGLPLISDLLKARATNEEKLIAEVVAEEIQGGIVNTDVDNSFNEDNLNTAFLSGETTTIQDQAGRFSGRNDAEKAVLAAMAKEIQFGVVNTAVDDSLNNNNGAFTFGSTGTNTAQGQNFRAGGNHGKKKDDFLQLLKLVANHVQGGVVNTNVEDSLNQNNANLVFFSENTNTLQQQKKLRAKQKEEQLLKLIFGDIQGGIVNTAVDDSLNNNNVAVALFSENTGHNQFQHHNKFKGRAQGHEGGEGHHQGGMHGRAITDTLTSPYDGYVDPYATTSSQYNNYPIGSLSQYSGY